MIRSIGIFLGVFCVGFAMFLASSAARTTIMGYIDTVSLLIVFGTAYFGMVAAYGTFKPDLKGLKLMNKLVVPAGWLGFTIGAVMMLYGSGVGDGENMAARLGLSAAIALLTVLYGILFRIILTIIIASKE